MRAQSHLGVAAVILITTWGTGFLGSAALNSVMRSDNPVVVRRGRIAFALLLAAELLWVARAFDTSGTVSRGWWWGVALGAGIPIALILSLTVRSAYSGHRPALVAAFLATAALFIAFPLAYVAPHTALTGLGRFAHEHRSLDIVALLVPVLILLADETRRGHIEGSRQEFTVFQRLRISLRAIGIGGAIALAFLLWLAGVNPALVMLSLVVFGVGLIVYAEVQTRIAARRMRRSFER